MCNGKRTLWLDAIVCALFLHIPDVISRTEPDPALVPAK